MEGEGQGMVTRTEAPPERGPSLDLAAGGRRESAHGRRGLLGSLTRVGRLIKAGEKTKEGPAHQGPWEPTPPEPRAQRSRPGRQHLGHQPMFEGRTSATEQGCEGHAREAGRRVGAAPAPFDATQGRAKTTEPAVTQLPQPGGDGQKQTLDGRKPPFI